MLAQAIPACRDHKVSLNIYNIESDPKLVLHFVVGREKPHMCIWPLNMNTE